MPVEDLISQFGASSGLMKLAIAADDRAKIARLDKVLDHTFEAIVGFDARNAPERLAVGRFLASFVETSSDKSPLTAKCVARLAELLGGQAGQARKTAIQP